LIRISVERGSGIEILCTDPRVPRNETNTCYRIAELAMQSLGSRGRIVIKIQKRLPIQGGLGAASSNAVSTLIGLQRVLRKSVSAIESLRIAAEVGSDLPLFLLGGTVLGAGRGEEVYPLPDLPATACVVVTPDVGVSTPKAFADWDGARAAKPGSAGQPRAAVPTQLQSKLTLNGASDRMNELGCSFSAWLSEQYSGAAFGRGRAEYPLLALVRAGIKNDFEQVVFPEHPELVEVKKALLRAGAKYASLSGSGSSLYGLFASTAAAVKATARLRKQGWKALATSTLPRRTYWNRLFGSTNF
jgi:4-diphosphocytidyl-2-C-methyl-D-erythritol kinase